ncbi:hypothetical protein BDV35DRAFT_283915 [Aspergillus flavus]|uniref:Uncharacterized protein n=1 Tax=Aspergillus flavus TaxID=5059 RepID=A0A5N6GW65_ASPFL|nr:hypothetical protein BDV35DRAFT_283915 [Aspergillus flavus]
MVYDDLLDEIAEKDIPSSDFKLLLPSRKEYCHISLVKTRLKSAVAASYSSSQGHRSLGHDDDAGDGFDPNTPSQRPREPQLSHPSASLSFSAVERSKGSHSQGKSRQYCTQKCLLGLIKEG